MLQIALVLRGALAFYREHDPLGRVIEGGNMTTIWELELTLSCKMNET